MKIKLILALVIGVLFYSSLLAQTTYTSNLGGGSGLWNNPLTWDLGAVPGASDNVIITAGDAVTEDINAICNWIEIHGTLTINNGITLTINGSDKANYNTENFTIDGSTLGALTNNGTLVLDQGAAGTGAIYSDLASGSFTNHNIFNLDNGGDFIASGTFINSGTINITSSSGNTLFENYTNINNTGGTFNVNNNSTFLNGLNGKFGLGNGIINMNAGGTYQHSQAFAGATIPTCTWNITSTCEILDISGSTPPSGLSQSFGNFIWNCGTSQSGTCNLNGVLTTIKGNFTINNIGTNKTLQLATTTSPTINITGNVVMNANGTDLLQFGTGGSATINVGGDFTISGGKLLMSGAAGSPTLNVTGNFLNSSTTASSLVMAGSSGNPKLNITGNFTHSSSAATSCSLSAGGGTGTLNLSGNFNYSSATPNLITSTSIGTGKFIFNKAGVQTFNSVTTTPFAAKVVQITVSSGSTLDMSSSASSITLQINNTFSVSSNGTLTTGSKTLTASASTTVTLASGATLNTNNASGVNATITGAGTRTFNNAANYVLGGASTTTGFTGANTTMHDLTITSSATLGETITVSGNFLNSAGTFTAGANTINLAGNFTNNGTFNGNTGTLVLNGTLAQTIGGTSQTDFNNITLSNSAGASISQSERLVGVLTINSGTFTTTGQTFTLLSTASGTASIGPILGSFAGSIIMQRYAPGSPNGNDWRFLSSAVSGAHISDWTDNFATSGFTGATCGPADCGNPYCSLTCNWPSIYTYDETKPGILDSGYVAATDVANSISNGKGFWVYLGPTPVTFDVPGAPNMNSQTFPVTYTNTGSPTDDGWNMVPNPYPCAIDWGAITDGTHWTKTGINDAVYIYNSSASNGGYASYVAGGSINGGSRYIASQQSFWIQASGAPTLTVRELVKASAQNPTFQKNQTTLNISHYPMAFRDFPIPQNTTNPNSIRLTSNGNGHNDEILIRFMQGATNNFDGQYDAWKLKNPSAGAQNFSSVITGNHDLSINSYPELTSDVTIPLRLTVPDTGTSHVIWTYTISRDSILMLPTSSCIVLEDKATNTMVDLRTTVSYTFTISDTTVAPRFFLHIYAPITKKSMNVTCAGGNNGIAIAKGIGTGPWNYVWKNSAGTVLKTTPGSLTADTLFNCASGTYSVSVNGAVCGTVTDTFNISAPQVLSNIITQTNMSCFGVNNGTATISPLGGTPSYTYLWNNSQTTSTATGLSFGNYSVLTTDANGCTATATVTITQPTALTNTVSQTNISCFGGNDGSASIFTFGGNPSYSYLWDNNQTTSTATGLSFRNYSVTTTDANGCTTTTTVAITQPAAISVAFTASTYSLDISVSNSITFTNSSSGSTSYQWNFGDASAINTSTNPTHSYTATGTYTVTLIASDGTCSDSTHQVIVVVNSNPLAVNSNPSLSNSVNVLYDNGEVFLLFSLDQKTQINISVYNMIGEKISSQNNLLVKNEKIKLDLPTLSAGMYIAVSDMGNAIISKKIFLPGGRY